MKISLKWVQEFVDVSSYFNRPEELAEILTRAGLEVEQIINRSKDYQHVLVGLILEKGKHPNADKLSLCRVTTGEGVVHQIVCGAQNHKADDKVIVALPGAILPGDFQIKRSSIRGVESGGMLCSLKELGLADVSDGIEILPVDAPIGKSYAEYAGLDDVIFELKVTPNRADCLSHFGLAREIACLLKKDLKLQAVHVPFIQESTKTKISLAVKSHEQCLRYSGRYIRGVKVGPSPVWLKKRLEAVGLNSINNIVDVTNFVMLEQGQPLHAFDASTISGKSMVVDFARAGESFVTLDGTELKLKGTEMMIKDSDRSLCMAGVIGGKNSGVSDTTTDIFLESAYFMPMAVRKAARQHGIETDSAYRFSRGVDPDGAMQASDKATQLILQLAGGEALSDPYDIYPQPLKKQPVEISIKTVTDRLGYVAQEALFEDFMLRLGCVVEKKISTDALNPSNLYSVLPPSFRMDLENDMDLVEEYARLNGYDLIPESVPSLTMIPATHDKNFILSQKVSSLLQGQGYYQAVNFGFVSAKKQTDFLGPVETLKLAGLKTDEDAIAILNPLNEDLGVMRKSLSLGLFHNMVNNFHYSNLVGRLYEMGPVFFKGVDPSTYLESSRLGMISWGQDSHLWNKNPQHPLIFELKGAVEFLLESLNLSAFTWVRPGNDSEVPSFLHRKQYATLLLEGKKVGFIGTFHPVLLEENKIRVPAVVAELDLQTILSLLPRPLRVKSISKMPLVERDFALVMADSIKVGDVQKWIKKTAGGILQKIQVFDVYQGEGMEPGTQSVGFRMSLQDKDATLQDAQISELVQKILEGLKKEFAITVR